MGTHASTQPAFCMQRRSVVKPFGSEKLALFAAVSRTSFRAQCSAHCSVLPNYRAVLKVQSSNAISFTLGVGMITDAFLLRGGTESLLRSALSDAAEPFQLVR